MKGYTKNCLSYVYSETASFLLSVHDSLDSLDNLDTLLYLKFVNGKFVNRKLLTIELPFGLPNLKVMVNSAVIKFNLIARPREHKREKKWISM